MATEAEKRMHRCCFTGHRPEKLQEPEDAVTAALEKEIRQAIADGFNVFITGMARGVDIWAADRAPAPGRWRSCPADLRLPVPGLRARVEAKLAGTLPGNPVCRRPCAVHLPRVQPQLLPTAE